MTEPRILFWDLENSPMTLLGFGLWNQNFGLDAIVEQSRVLCFGARWYGEPKSKYIFKSVHHDGREAMLQSANELLSEADAVVSWNGQGFDTKVMKREFLLENLPPVPDYRELDLMRVVKKHFRFSSNKLDNVARELGVGEKVKHEGMALWRSVMEGDEAAWKRFAKYQRKDVDLLVDLYEILKPYTTFNWGLYTGAETACPHCGSGDVEKRGTRTTLTGYTQRYWCQKCRGWSSSSHRLGTTSLRSVG